MPPEVPGVELPHLAAHDVLPLKVAGSLLFQVQKLVPAIVPVAVRPSRKESSAAVPTGRPAAALEEPDPPLVAAAADESREGPPWVAAGLPQNWHILSNPRYRLVMDKT